ncbi:MAG: YfhO family protein [bacterium]
MHKKKKDKLKKQHKEPKVDPKESIFISEANKKYPNLLPIGIIAGLCILYFWQVLFFNKTFYFEDIVTFCYPLRYMLADWLKQGEFPLWNPYIFSGMPYLGDIQAALFYPFNIFYYILPTDRAIAYYIVLHFFLAGLSMYTYLRVIKLDIVSALFGSLTFSYSTFIFGEIRHLIIIGVSVWFPLLFALLELTIYKRSLWYAILGAGIFALEILGGHIQLVYYTGLAMGVYLLVKGIQLRSQRVQIKRIAATFLIIVILGPLLASIQLIPFAETISFSPRLKSSYEATSYFSLPPKELIDLLIPNFTNNLDNSYRGWDFWNTCGYTGVLPIVFAILALIFRRNWYTLFFGIGAVFGIIAALGKHTPLNYLMFKYLPLYDKLHVPSRFIYYTTIGISILGSFGLNFLLSPMTNVEKRKLGWIILFLCGLIIPVLFPTQGLTFRLPFLPTAVIYLALLIGSIGVVFLRFRGIIKPNMLKMAVLIILLCDLWTIGVNYAPIVDGSKCHEKPTAFQLLEKEKGYYRIIVDRSLLDYLDRGITYKVCTANGYNSTALKGYMDYLWYNEHPELPIGSMPEDIRAVEIKNQHTKMVDLLNVKYVIGLRKIGDNYYEGLFKNEDYLPRAFVAYNYEVIEEEEKILPKLNSAEFEPQNTIILQEKPTWPESQLDSSTQITTAQIMDFSPNKITLEAYLEKNGLLFLSEIYYPGWTAYVDGKESKIYCANYTFRALALTPGKHTIKFIYAPHSFKMGIKISLFSLLCFLIIITSYPFIVRSHKVTS